MIELKVFINFQYKTNLQCSLLFLFFILLYLKYISSTLNQITFILHVHFLKFYIIIKIDKIVFNSLKLHLNYIQITIIIY